MNKVILCGNLGKDPEVREIGENKLATFSLATNEKWKTGERPTGIISKLGVDLQKL